MHTVILDDLSKTFSGGKEAVKNVSLSLDAGEVFGFLGPNGAGKTTTVKMLTGILKPTDGSCMVMGFDPVYDPEKVHAASGVVTEQAMMYDNMTGMENLIFYGTLFGLSCEEAKGERKPCCKGSDFQTPATKGLQHIPQVCASGFPSQGLSYTAHPSCFWMSPHQVLTLKAPRMSTISSILLPENAV